ncbi:MAG: response regulator transcription factor [Rubrobacteraceae bacterium]|nr:response regulator transcription factor [Rubrobacteraceae bacterium]
MHALEDDTSDPIRVLLVEDHALFRQALSLLLYRRQQMEVIQAGTLAEARLLLGGVDVVALDNILPDGAGVELIGDVRSSNPSASVLVLSDGLDSANAESALAAGADAVLSKVESPFAIIEEIKLLAGTGSAPQRTS